MSIIKRLCRKIVLYINFIKDFSAFKKQTLTTDPRFIPSWKDRFPRLYENTSTTYFDIHYIYHPAWAVRILRKINPQIHIDISSTLNFSAIASAFIPIDFYDYRPANLRLSGLNSLHADLLELPFPSNSIVSISCMHTIEHIGLGRYGDPIDPTGDLKAIAELKRVTAIGGSLIFVVPVGKPKIAYNAHRIYSYKQIMSYFPEFELQEFALIPDNGIDVGIVVGATEELCDNQNYGCGCFWFKKILK